MKLRRMAFLPVTLLLISAFPGNVFASSSFYDVTDDTLYSPYIQRLYDAHLITGDTDNGKETYRYRPKDSLTRAEFTKVAVGVKLAEKYGMKEDWQSKSAYELTETVLKDKLLYFHGCSNADLPNCTSLCSADICGVCNVCQIIGEKPFTDVAVKSRDCEEEGVCTPWYSEYIYYALRKGMVKGYREGSGYAFHPSDPILRIHALKLVMADDGAVDPEADERYRILSQLAKAKGAYFPKCLVGAEQYILKNNGGEGSLDGEKLLKYALLADKLDLFGNSCQIFAEKGARNPEERAAFLQKPITRQEVARYFVISSTYPPIFISPFEDDTVDGIVNNTQDPESVVTKVITDDGDVAWDFSGVKLGTLNVYSDNEPIPIEDVVSPDSGFESTFNRSACILSGFTPKICRDPSMANCVDVPNGSRIHTTEEEYYGRTPTGYYTWLWHGVIYNGIGYYAPLDDIDFDCERTLAWEEAKRQAAAEAAKIRAYNAKVAAHNAAVKKQQEEAQRQADLASFGITTADIFGHNGGVKPSSTQLMMSTLPSFSSAVSTTPFVNLNSVGKTVCYDKYCSQLSTQSPPTIQGNARKWVYDNIEEPLQEVHDKLFSYPDYIGKEVSKMATKADQKVMSGFNSVPDWIKPVVQPLRTQYNYSKAAVKTGASLVEGGYTLIKDPVGVVGGIADMAWSCNVSNPDYWRGKDGKCGKMGAALGNSLVEFGKDSLLSRDKLEENSARGVFEIGLFFVGAGEAKGAITVSKIAELGKTGTKAVEMVKYLDAVEDTTRIAKGLEQWTDTVKLGEVLTQMESGKSISVFSKMQPAKATELVLGMSKTTAGNMLTKMDDLAVARLLAGTKDVEQMAKVAEKLELARLENLAGRLAPDKAAELLKLSEEGKNAATLAKEVASQKLLLKGFSEFTGESATGLQYLREYGRFSDEALIKAMSGMSQNQAEEFLKRIKLIEYANWPIGSFKTLESQLSILRRGDNLTKYADAFKNGGKFNLVVLNNLAPADSIGRLNVVFRDGKFKVGTRTLKGRNYDFVYKNGEIFIGEGHVKLAQPIISNIDITETVDFAGTIHFNSNGKINGWANASGHFKPIVNSVEDSVVQNFIEAFNAKYQGAGLSEVNFQIISF